MLRTSVSVSVGLLLAAIAFAQQPSKPQISGITVLPSDPVVPTGNCTSSSAGYLEKSRQGNMTDQQLGEFVSKSLHDGYIVTIYPTTKSGIFVTVQCTNTTTSVKP